VTSTAQPRPTDGGAAPPVGDRRWSDDIRSLGLLGRSWAVGVVLFSAARALLAWPTLGRFGVDPWAFLAIDLITAPPYGIAQAVTVKLLCRTDRSWRDAAGWAVVVVVTFLAPYAYIFAASGSLPAGATAGVVVWMLVFGGIALWRTVRQVRAGRSSNP